MVSPGGIESERIFAMRLSFKSFQGKERGTKEAARTLLKQLVSYRTYQRHFWC